MSRINDSMVTDLPEPDSPTMPSVSPRFRSKLTPSTARTVPQRVSKIGFQSVNLQHHGGGVFGCASSHASACLRVGQRSLVTRIS